MKPGININCERYPFDKWILNKFKLYETRGKNTLKRFVGQRVFLIKTGCGAPVIFAEATISKVIKCENRRDYMDYAHACMTLGTKYDWKPDTKCKYLYKLTDVVSIADIPVPADAVRHGYVWREIEE